MLSTNQGAKSRTVGLEHFLSTHTKQDTRMNGSTNIFSLLRRQARHLMLLSNNNAALGLLFDLKMLDHSDTDVLFGSDFAGDRTDVQVGVGAKSFAKRPKLCGSLCAISGHLVGSTTTFRLLGYTVEAETRIKAMLYRCPRYLRSQF